jgi:hypothetical protein
MSLRDNSVPVTLTSDGGVVVFDPATRLFFEGVDFKASTRVDATAAPQRHGTYRDPGFKEGGLLAGEARLYGDGVLLHQNRTMLERVLNGCLGGGGVAAWLPPGGPARQYLTDLYLVDYDFKIDGSSYLVSIQLGASKSFSEDETATTQDSAALTETGGGFVVPLVLPITFTESAGGDLTVTNEGSFYSYPVLRAYGPIVNPTIVNQTTGELLTFVGSIASGDYWEVDLHAQSVKLNGTQTVRALNVAASSWFACGFGTTQLQLAGSGFTAQTLLRAYMRSAYG